MIDVDILQAWRRADLEARIYAGRPGLPGNIAGDITIGPRSIRFSFEQHDAYPFVSLSAEMHTRCSNRDVERFMQFAKLVAVREIKPRTRGTCVRTFEIAAVQ